MRNATPVETAQGISLLQQIFGEGCDIELGICLFPVVTLREDELARFPLPEWTFYERRPPKNNGSILSDHFRDADGHLFAISAWAGCVQLSYNGQCSSLERLAFTAEQGPPLATKRERLSPDGEK